jgi:Catalase
MDAAPHDRSGTPDIDRDIDTALGERYYKNDMDVERKLAAEITGIIRQFIGRRFKEGRRPALRDAHAQDNGCVKAIFRVDADIAEDLRHGVFATPGREFEAWIRFSNGNSEVLSPRLPDARGMAVKLVGVDGPKLLDDEPDTQDLLMANNPGFFVDDLERYKNALVTFHAGGYMHQVFALHALKWRERLQSIRTNFALPITNPLYSQYWSMTSYRLGAGEGRIAIKYTAKPRVGQMPGIGSRLQTFLSPHFSLKENMQDILDSREMWFDFFIQRYMDERSTPIEDNLTEWTAQASPPVPVAKIIIPAQDLGSAERARFCENLSFNPWHCLAEHKPLGVVNRVRKAIYREISAYRHQLNSPGGAMSSADGSDS